MKTEDGLYELNWTTLPESSKAYYKLVLCKCKKGCVRHCKCKKAVAQLHVYMKDIVHKIDSVILLCMYMFVNIYLST